MTIAPPSSPTTPYMHLLVSTELGSPTFSEISLGSPLSPTSKDPIKGFKWTSDSIPYKGSVLTVDIIELIFRNSAARTAYTDELNAMPTFKVEHLLTSNPHKETGACVKITTLIERTEKVLEQLLLLFPSLGKLIS